MRRGWIAAALVACRSEPTAPAPPVAISTANANATSTSTSTSSSTPTAPATPTARAHVDTDWCIDGLTALDVETCYVLPAPKPRRLLLYLHGITPPLPESPQKRAVQSAVLAAATRAGAAALVPRGVRGVGPGDAHDWWAWPTDPGSFEKLAPSLLARFADARAKLESIAGAPFERVYVAGSSNGAYFITMLAARADARFDGFGAISGGAAPRALAPPARPFYVGYGTYDPETKTNARGLVRALEDAKWPVRAAEHPFGHGARDVYLDEAFAFWDEPR
ncbi:MAG TPA: hypothetical protein VIF62_01575 [Labilithrix sp.]|jgi:predicted esterase